MDKKTVLSLVIIILVAIALFSILSTLSLKRRSRRENTFVGIELPMAVPVAVPKPVTAKPEPVKIVAPAVEVIAKKEIPENKKEKVPFWGNRGYLTKNRKSTFVTIEELIQLKIAYEAASLEEREN